jgi:hypothetical protein
LEKKQFFEQNAKSVKNLIILREGINEGFRAAKKTQEKRQPISLTKSVKQLFSQQNTNNRNFLKFRRIFNFRAL